MPSLGRFAMELPVFTEPQPLCATISHTIHTAGEKYSPKRTARSATGLERHQPSACQGPPRHRSRLHNPAPPSRSLNKRAHYLSDITGQYSHKERTRHRQWRTLRTVRPTPGALPTTFADRRGHISTCCFPSIPCAQHRVFLQDCPRVTLLSCDNVAQCSHCMRKKNYMAALICCAVHATFSDIRPTSLDEMPALAPEILMAAMTSPS